MTYTGWDPKEVASSTNEDCLLMRLYPEKNKGHKWSVALCQKTNAGYICERDVVKPNKGFQCPDGYTVYAEGEACFKVHHNVKLNWQDARELCQKDGGDLALAIDDPINIFLSGLLTRGIRYWIGLRSYDADPHKYLWVNTDKEQSTVTGNWLPSEPNGAHEQCVEYAERRGSDFAWNDHRCEKNKIGAICQRGGTTVILNLHPVDIEGETYFFAMDSLRASDVESKCKEHNMTQLLIQSNEHFTRIQDWVSNSSDLQGGHIWVQTMKPLFWDFNAWSNNEFVDPNAWVSDNHDRQCSKDQDCCVSMMKDAHRHNDTGGHYLANTPCSDTAIYICVQENTIPEMPSSPPPKIEPPAEAAKTLKQIMTTPSGNQTTSNKLCPCRCGITFNPNPTPAELDRMKDQIVKKLLVKTDRLSATVSKKVSAPDDRASSQTFGFAAIVLVCLPVTFIIAIDLSRICQPKPQ